MDVSNYQFLDKPNLVAAKNGWPSYGESVVMAIPSKSNAMKYFLSVQE